LLLILTQLLFLSSCWDMEEIDGLGLVTAVGIDKGTSPNKYSVTVQIANPSSGTSGDKSSSTNSVWIGTEEGESIFAAVRKLVNISSRRIMWAHNNVVIIGEPLAKEGIIPVIDYFTHDPQLRMKTGVVVAKGEAKEYISANAGMESPSGISFILLESFRAISAESVESHMLDVTSELKSKYGNPLISTIGLKEVTMQGGDGNSKANTSESIDLSGTAVFKKDRMIGLLSPEESRGVSWILNETKDTVVTVNDPGHGNKSVSVETTGVKAKLKSEVVDGIPSFTVNVTGKGDIVEEDGSTNLGLNQVKENVSEMLNQKIRNEIIHTLEVIQKKYRVDVLGFAAIVHSQNKGEWKSGLKDKWQEIFPKIPVTVSVDIKINSSTLNQEPMHVY